MTHEQFVSLVRKMRDCQKFYSRTHIQEVGEEMKDLEFQVDMCVYENSTTL